MNTAHTKYILIFSILASCIAAVSYAYIDIPAATYFFPFQRTFSGKIFKGITMFGRGEWYLVPGILLFIAFRHRKKRLAFKALFLFSSVAISGIAVNILKFILGRARPMIYLREDLFGFTFFRFEADFLSFPSGHSATALSAAVVFSILYPRYRYLFCIIGIIIASSRMLLLYHYLSDVIVGALFGALTSIMLYESIFKKRINNLNSEKNHADHQ